MFCFVEAADVEYEQLEARIVQLTNEKEELVNKWQRYEEELKTANECEISVLCYI